MGQFIYGDLLYKFKKIVHRADFSDQFRKIIVRYKRIGYNINIMRQFACLVFNPITVKTLLPSLIARRWVGRQTQWWPRHKAIYFSWSRPEIFCLLLGPPGFNCWFSFAPVFQWCCSTPRTTFTRTEQLYVLSHDRSQGRGWDPVKSV